MSGFTIIKIRNSKHEIRNKPGQNSKLGKSKTPIPVSLVSNIVFVCAFIVLILFRISYFGFRAFEFDHSDLFRISDFEIRIFVYSALLPLARSR